MDTTTRTAGERQTRRAVGWRCSSVGWEDIRETPSPTLALHPMVASGIVMRRFLSNKSTRMHRNSLYCEHARTRSYCLPKAILNHLGKFEYASRPHVVLTLLWHTMIRVGAAHALVLDDHGSENQSLQVVYRSETGSPTKNKEAGQRFIALSDEVCTILDDGIETWRFTASSRSSAYYRNDTVTVEAQSFDRECRAWETDARPERCVNS